MSNESGLYPLGLAVLVEPYEVQQKKSAIVLPDMVKDREVMVETRAVVVEIGPCAWMDEPQPRAKVGDHVFITRFAGQMAIGPKDGKKYRLINDRDIYCRIDPPAQEEA